MSQPSDMSPSFRRILVAYDGSEPSEHALSFGMALGRAGAALDVLHFIDETSVIAQSMTVVGIMDPTPIIDALDRQGRALLAAAHERARAAGIDVSTSLIHERLIPGICAAADKNGDELIVLGTHARTGFPRTFLGSTTEGVLRSATLPILAVSAAMKPPSSALFQKVLVAVDESDPADAAVALAAGLSRTLGTQCVLCNVLDTRDLYDKAALYGYDSTQFSDQMRLHARDVIERARIHGGFANAVTTVIVEDEPSQGILAEAVRSGAEAIVIGSHGRRGLQRLFLGSVAEYVLRHSPMPVFVVRELARKAGTLSP